jgi:WD40 repeat protein
MKRITFVVEGPASQGTMPMGGERLRVFISSPGDVAEERVLANNLVRRLADEYNDRLWIEPVFWEHEPLLATSTFQKQIPPPRDCEIVVCILWSRLGTRLPADITRPDGSRYDSGTEYEFEDAALGFQASGRPELIVYRKTADPVVSLKDTKALLDRVAQKEALDRFIAKWFIDEKDGTLKAAYHAFGTTAEFERLLEEHLHKLIGRRRLTGSDRVARRELSWKAGSPFRGLDVFEFEHAPVFFGRTQAIGDILNALRANAAAGRAFVLVVGVSGGGKSSLVRAGVMPILVQPGVIEGVGFWRRAIFKPSDSDGDLLGALASAILDRDALPELGSDGTTAEQLAELMRQGRSATFPLIKGGLSQAAATLAREQRLEQQPEARLAIVVDQLEELFTLPSVTHADRQEFFGTLSSLAQSGKVWVIATLRGDYYHRAFEHPELIALQEGAGLYALPLPTAAEIGQMIRHPATAAGLSFEEDPQTKIPLDESLREAAGSSPESLPLLEFTLEELYQRKTSDGVLTFAAYRELGGVEGALTKRAESIFAALPPDVQAALPHVMRNLVSVADGGGVSRIQAKLDEAAATPQAKSLIEAFVAATLFTTDRKEQREPVVRVTHEALLRAWPRVQQWLARDRELLIVRARVNAAAARWQAEGQRSDLLLSEGKPLAEAEALSATMGPALLEPERSLIAASLGRAKRRVLMKRAAIASLVVLAAAASLAATVARWQGAKADRNAKIASENEKRANASAKLASDNEALAKENEKEAREQAAIATSRQLAALSATEREKRLDMSLILAVEALRIGNTFEARNNLSHALQARPALTSFLHVYEGQVHGVTFSPDGKTIAAGYCQRGPNLGSGVLLWDAIGRTRLVDAPLEVKEGKVLCVAFSPDGKSIAAGYYIRNGGGGVVLWGAADHRRVVALEVTDGGVHGVAFSPDGKTIVAAYGRDDNVTYGHDVKSGGVVLWGMAARQRLVDPPLPVKEGSVSSVAFSPDGKTIAAGYHDTRPGGGVVLWDAANRKRLVDAPLDVKEGFVTSVAFSRDGTSVAAGYYGAFRPGGVVLLDAGGRKRIVGAPFDVKEGQVMRVAFSSDGKTFAAGYAAGYRGGVVVWDAEDRKRLLAAPIEVSEGSVGSVAFSPDGETIAAGYGEGDGGDGVVLLRGAGRKRPVDGSLDVNEGYVRSVAFRPDGKVIAAGFSGNTGLKFVGGVVLWDAAGRRRLVDSPLDVEEGPVSSVAFSPDGTTIAAGYSVRNGGGVVPNGGGVVLWDAAGRKRLVGTPLSVAGGGVSSVAFSPDGKSIAAGYYIRNGGGGVVLWGAADHRRVVALEVTEGGVRSVAFSPDGKTIAAGYSEQDGLRGGVVLWDATSGKPLIAAPLQVKEGDVRSVAFSPDGKTIAAGSHGPNWSGVVLWDATSHRRLAAAPFDVKEGEDRGVAFSPEGKTIAAGYTVPRLDRISGVMLWDAASRKRLVDAPLVLNAALVHCVAFSPDGKTVAAGYSLSANRHGVLLWDVNPESWMNIAGQITNRNLTRAEWRQYFPEQPYHATFPDLTVPPEAPRE